ncbi:MAG: spore coat protein CotJB [Lachnospiraceae bacterium]|nr:spore coat protein CotJB [Lachnospiraceae bacterium]
MRNTPMNREQLFHWINEVSFAVNDITLYLDTHPEDEEAISYFNHYSEMRRKALRTYEEHYGPLTIDTASPTGNWCWATQKWPWEGGNC